MKQSDIETVFLWDEHELEKYFHHSYRILFRKATKKHSSNECFTRQNTFPHHFTSLEVGRIAMENNVLALRLVVPTRKSNVGIFISLPLFGIEWQYTIQIVCQSVLRKNWERGKVYSMQNTQRLRKIIFAFLWVSSHFPPCLIIAYSKNNCWAHKQIVRIGEGWASHILTLRDDTT